MLKTNWERTYQHPEVSKKLLKKAVTGYSIGTVDDIKLLSNGCGNSNYRVTFKSAPAILLRIYLRDSTSMEKESKLLKTMDQDVPIPEMFLADSTKKTMPFFFSINQFVEGELMRDVILNGKKKTSKNVHILQERSSQSLKATNLTLQRSSQSLKATNLTLQDC